MNTIIVQMSDAQWTKEAMHLASALALNTNSRIMMLHLITVNNPGLLGWELAPAALDVQQYGEFGSIAEDYGVEFCVQPMLYATLTDALAQAAESHEASVLFANIPHSKLPLWRRIELWNLKRQIGDCQLYTLDKEQVLSVEGSMLSPVNRMKTLAH
jgi:hypothetical protein